MSDSTEHPGYSLVFTDQDQNYYLIPVEVFERGRVPAEHKAAVEEALREHEVTGYYLVVAAGMVLGGALVGAGFVAGAAVGAGAVAAGVALGGSR
jgi:hypothetical protein